MPSVVYGLLGLGIFARFMRMGPSLLAGALTLAVMSLPVIIVAAREAVRAVPDGIRDGAYALGATRWQTVRRQVLPAAMPGTLTGTILALSRAIGETAPLLVIGLPIDLHPPRRPPRPRLRPAPAHLRLDQPAPAGVRGGRRGQHRPGSPCCWP